MSSKKPTKNTKPQYKSSTAERLVTGMMTLFFIGFGWNILLTGGVSLSGKKGISYIDGNGALIIAGGTFLIASVCALMFSKTMGFGRQRRAVLIALVLLPPAIFLFLKS